ncbi:MAG: hypothetical protein KAT34_14170 [Candidatus Aminicenantes bacterium]|nr:hypothetical protein [Candidatus Aminicenantes bacterium]
MNRYPPFAIRRNLRISFKICGIDPAGIFGGNDYFVIDSEVMGRHTAI